jgi:hypothetical protein
MIVDDEVPGGPESYFLRFIMISREEAVTQILDDWCHPVSLFEP